MKPKRKKYTPEFKREVLAMVAEGQRRVAQIERDLGITSGLIYKWQERYQVQDEQRQPSPERVEAARIRQLARELAIVKQERAILKKASQICSPGNTLI